MTAIPVQTLLDEVKCYACYGLSLREMIKIALLNRILNP